MKRAIILHTIEDAKHCFKNGLQQQSILLSTHASVDLYMRECYGIECRCLSAYLTNADILEMRNTASNIVDMLLNILDESVSTVINKQLGLTVKWFEILYSYLGKHHLYGYLCFVKAVKNAIIEHQLQSLSCYEMNFNSFFTTTSGISDVLPIFQPTHCSLLEYSHPLDNSGSDFCASFYQRLNSVIANPGYVFTEIMKRLMISGAGRLSLKNKKILFCDFSYNLKFLNYALLKKYRILTYSKFLNDARNRFATCRIDIPNISLDAGALVFYQNGQRSLVELFLRDILEDFHGNIKQYANYILVLKAFHSANPVALCIAGCPPIEKVKALCFGYLRSEGVKVVIGQHGALYGEAYEPWHFDSDFNRCDAFISYGFNQADLRRLYTDKKISPAVYPLGYISPIRSRKKKRTITLLFPITNTVSIFKGGMSRLPPDKLLERQVRFLEYLNTKKHFKIYIKPLLNSNEDNCAILPLMRKLRNLTLVNNMTLTQFLGSYHPTSVLIEYPSTPLTEVIALDTEIFVVPDDTAPYDATVLKKLRRRVHYCPTVEEAIEKMESFFDGKLKHKRDAGYLSHYVHKGKTERNIVSLINELVDYAS
jgi:hypothetical protein